MFLVFHSFFSFPSTTFLQTTLLSLHPTTTIHTLPHEGAGNAVNDNTLALFLFTTPHHHFTRPSLPSHSPPHSSSLLTHCVQPLPMVSPTMPCKHLWSCNSRTIPPPLLSSHSHHSCRLLGGALAIPMPLCAPPVAWKAWCCACHVLPFHSFHSCPPLLPFSHSHSVCHWLSLCVKHIHQ